MVGAINIHHDLNQSKPIERDPLNPTALQHKVPIDPLGSVYLAVLIKLVEATRCLVSAPLMFKMDPSQCRYHVCTWRPGRPGGPTT